MDTKDWVPEESISELKALLARRWRALLVILVSTVTVGYNSIVQLQAGAAGIAFFQQTVTVLFCLYAIHFTYHTLLFKLALESLVEKQDNALNLDSVRMLAQIEVELGDKNDEK